MRTGLSRTKSCWKGEDMKQKKVLKEIRKSLMDEYKLSKKDAKKLIKKSGLKKALEDSPWIKEILKAEEAAKYIRKMMY